MSNVKKDKIVPLFIYFSRMSTRKLNLPPLSSFPRAITTFLLSFFFFSSPLNKWNNSYFYFISRIYLSWAQLFIGTEMSLSRISIVFHVVLKTLKSRHLDNSRLRNGCYRWHRPLINFSLRFSRKNLQLCGTTNSCWSPRRERRPVFGCCTSGAFEQIENMAGFGQLPKHNERLFHRPFSRAI